MTNFKELQTKRRSIYALEKNVELSNQELVDTIQGAILQTPSAFHSQTTRVVILLDKESDAFWNEIAYSELEKVTPAEAFEATKQRLAGFAQAKGTILFFEDQDVVKGLQEKFPSYAENFPLWSEQAHGISLYATWLALAEKNNIESIAIPCISTGDFNFPKQKAAEIAIKTVKTFIDYSDIVKKVIFNVFDDENLSI